MSYDPGHTSRKFWCYQKALGEHYLINGQQEPYQDSSPRGVLTGVWSMVTAVSILPCSTDGACDELISFVPVKQHRKYEQCP